METDMKAHRVRLRTDAPGQFQRLRWRLTTKLKVRADCRLMTRKVARALKESPEEWSVA